jgi:hypothetical protein
VSTAAGSRRRPDDRAGRFDPLTAWSALVSFLVTVNLVFQRLQSTAAEPSAGSAAGYWVAAGLLIALQVGLLARAVRRGRGGLVLVSIVALVCAVGAAVVLSVPAVDWRPEPPAHTLDPNYRPCFSGSGDCVGG